MSDAFQIAGAGIILQAGILLATVKFIGQRQDEQKRDTKKDLDGIGRKQRAMLAEQIIEAKDSPNFAVMVRKLINGI